MPLYNLPGRYLYDPFIRLDYFFIHSTVPIRSVFIPDLRCIFYVPSPYI